MSKGAKLSDLTRLTQITDTPHPAAPAVPQSTPPRVATERLVRFTAEVPKNLHRALKTYAMNEDTTTYAVTRALFTLLAEDEDVAAKVRSLLSRENHAELRGRASAR